VQEGKQMSEKQKIRVVVDMFGGTIEGITHDSQNVEIDVIFTENRKYSDREEETMVNEDTFIYSHQMSEPSIEWVEKVFAKGDEYDESI
jgi:O-acetylhomoserine/O-acetylserine sulfhydrylase-like pyridoxal-dependent enzyme